MTKEIPGPPENDPSITQITPPDESGVTDNINMPTDAEISEITTQHITEDSRALAGVREEISTIDDGEAPQSDEEDSPMLKELEEFQISGDPVRDAIQLDKITGGNLGEPLTSGRMDPLRLLVNIRSEEQGGIDRFKARGVNASGQEGGLTGAAGRWQVVAPKMVEVIDKILESYGVTAQNQQEYDSTYGSNRDMERIDNILTTLRDFRPSGDISRDLSRYCLITGQPWVGKRMENGERPERLLLVLKKNIDQAQEANPRQNPTRIDETISDEALPLENEVITRMLEHYKVKPENTENQGTRQAG
jgi:hypothetical protein